MDNVVIWKVGKLLNKIKNRLGITNGTLRSKLTHPIAKTVYVVLVIAIFLGLGFVYPGIMLLIISGAIILAGVGAVIFAIYMCVSI